MKAFTFANSHPALWKVGMNIGAKVMKATVKNGKAPLNIGVIGEWTNTRDLPDADGESFRSWFKNRNNG